MANKIDLNGKNAIVTGGAQGIGRAIVERFLQSGAAAAIWDRDAKLAEKTAAELKGKGRVAAITVDVTQLAEVERARDETLKAFGRIDILVNNAGIAGPNVKTWEYDPEAWAQVMRVNLDSQFYCCRAIVPSMIAQNYGRIVNIASIAGKEGNPNAPAYSASKAGRDRADEIARQGARQLRHRGQLHHAGGGEDRDLRSDDEAAYRFHAVENSARALCRGRRDRGFGRLLRLGRLLLHHRRGVRHFRRPGDLLNGSGPAAICARSRQASAQPADRYRADVRGARLLFLS